MTFQNSQNPHHPPKGSSIKIEPIRTKTAIANIKKILADKPRDLCLFTFGINTGWRANELLSIRVGQVRDIETGGTLELKQSKNDKYRTVTLNQTVINSVQVFMEQIGDEMGDSDYLFRSQRGAVLTVPSVIRLVKSWCAASGLKGNHGSHTLRKTWGYWQYKRGTPLPLLVEAFGHATQQQTLRIFAFNPEKSRISMRWNCDLNAILTGTIAALALKARLHRGSQILAYALHATEVLPRLDFSTSLPLLLSTLIALSLG